MKIKFLYIHLGIFAFLCIFFWITPVDEFMFSFLTFYLILPISMFVTMLFGFNKINKLTYVTMFILSALYMYEDYLTFSLANMIEFHKLNPPDYSMLLSGFFACLIGYLINKKIRIKKYVKE